MTAFQIFFLFVAITSAKTIDNKLLDTPAVTCGPEEIIIGGQSEDIFEGSIYIKNWRRTNGCSVSYSLEANSTNPQFSIPLNQIARCGLELRRNADSKDLEIFAVFVFSFHPNFVTAGDRSFAVHCIFLQQQITVATKFNFISEIGTRTVIGGTAEIPIVDLVIVPGRIADPSLEPAHTVTVGDQLMYIWKMNTNSEIYGLIIRECFAEARDGRRISIIEDSCSTDPLIVSHVQYSENMDKAFSDGMAFKFPDAEDVWISCVVQTCIRKFEHLIANENSTNLCIPQPQCNKRNKRDNIDQPTYIYSIEDLVHHKLRVTDGIPSQSALGTDLSQRSESKHEFCMQNGSFAGGLAALVAAYFTTISVAGGIFYKAYRSHSKKH